MTLLVREVTLFKQLWLALPWTAFSGQHRRWLLQLHLLMEVAHLGLH